METMPTATVDDGTELYYQDVGSGPPIVLLHGGFMDHRVWDRQVAALRDDHRLVTPDLRGHGRSEKPPGGYTPNRLARDVASLVETTGLEDAVIVGWSLGATVTATYLGIASRPPPAVVLACSGIFQELAREESDRGLDVDALVTQHRSDPPTGMMEFVESLYAKPPTGPEVRWLWSIGMGTPLRVVLDVLEIYRTIDYREIERSLSDTSSTVGIFHGAHDGAASLDAAELVASDTVEDGRFVPFHESGHVPFLEEPDRFTEAVKSLVEIAVTVDGD